MELINILSREMIIPAAKISGKRQLLQRLAKLTAEKINLDEDLILEKLMERERLGSTGLGGGIAIPHAKIDNISQICACFARLERPIDFDSVDDQGVDLVIMLLAPKGSGADHLKALAQIARLLRNKNIVEQLRQTRNIDKIYALLTSPLENTDAA